MVDFFPSSFANPPRSSRCSEELFHPVLPLLCYPPPTPNTQDLLDIVDQEGKREPGKVDLRMGGFDLIWDGGPVMRFDKPTSLPRWEPSSGLGNWGVFAKVRRVELCVCKGGERSY